MYRVRFPCAAARATHTTRPKEGPTAAAVRITAPSLTAASSLRCRSAHSAAFLHRRDRIGTPGSRSWHACDELKTQVAAKAVSDHLRRHAERHVVWVHGKVAGIGWRVPLGCAYHRCSRRGFSGRHLLHHLLNQHSTRRRAPQGAALFLSSGSSAASFHRTGFAVAWRIASSRPLRSPLWADGQPAGCSRDTRRCLRICGTNPQTYGS